MYTKFNLTENEKESIKKALASGEIESVSLDEIEGDMDEELLDLTGVSYMERDGEEGVVLLIQTNEEFNAVRLGVLDMNNKAINVDNEMVPVSEL